MPSEYALADCQCPECKRFRASGYMEVTLDPAKGPLFTVYSDGSVVKGPAFTTSNAASLAFWKTITDVFPAFKQHIIQGAAPHGQKTNIH